MRWRRPVRCVRGGLPLSEAAWHLEAASVLLMLVLSELLLSKDFAQHLKLLDDIILESARESCTQVGKRNRHVVTIDSFEDVPPNNEVALMKVRLRVLSQKHWCA
jgi:hypothetical protein